MKDSVYLVADANGIVRMTKRTPSLYREEVAVRVTVSIPEAVFRSAVFSASVEVPEDRIITPEITVEAEPAPTEGAEG